VEEPCRIWDDEAAFKFKRAIHYVGEDWEKVGHK
jgi:hypothetical protein